jgi:hypothetical protein
MCFAGVLELNALDPRRFLFELPELISRWLDQAFLRPDKFPGFTIVRPFRSPGIMITNASFEICRHADVKGEWTQRICRYDLAHYARAKTRLRKDYVAAASFGKHAFQTRARRILA